MTHLARCVGVGLSEGRASFWATSLRFRSSFFRSLLLSSLCFFLSGCAAHARPATAQYFFPPPELPAVGTVVEGIASWYGPGYHGQRSSSGETYDQDELTAAHPYWAFGTRAKVTLLSTGRSVVVRINDRFPAHKGRAIDLSRAAAKAIGLIGPGTGQVRIEVVEAPPVM